MKNTFIFLAILSLGLILRLYNLDRYPLWYDEASAALEERSLFSLPPVSKFFNPKVSLQRQDYLFLYNHFFIYYWKKIFGNSEFNLRLSSVLFGIFGVYMIYKLGQLIYNKNAALISSFLLAISPFHIYYSQELRPYAAICFFSLLAFYSLFKIIKEGKTNYWIPYILANIINIYCLYMMLIVLLAEILFFIVNLKHNKDLLAKFIVSHLIILFMVTPVILIIIPNLIFILTHSVIVDLTDFPIWAQKINFNNILFTLKNFSVGYNIDFYSLIGLAMTFIYLFLFIIGCYRDNHKFRLMFNTILLVFPIFFIFIISKFIKLCYVDRYFFSAFPLYILCISNGLYRCRRIVGYFLFAIILILTAKGLQNYYLTVLPGEHTQHIGTFPKDSNINKVAQFILDNFHKGDKMYCTSTLLHLPLKFYINVLLNRHEGKNRIELISEVNEGRVLWTDNKDKLICISNKGTPPILRVSQPFVLSDDISRIWVIHNLFDPRPVVINKIENISVKTNKYNFKNIELFLFILRKGDTK